MITFPTFCVVFYQKMLKINIKQGVCKNYESVFERYLRLSNLAHSSPEENATETSMLGVLYPVLSPRAGGHYNISRRGLSRVAYPGQGMREPDSGMSEE